MMLGSQDTHTPRCYEGNKPNIKCIATHAYKRKVAEAKEQSYIYSFNKPQEYIDELKKTVQQTVFEDLIDNHFTPQYVFEEIDGVFHTPEHPLISKGLLSSYKHEQVTGLTLKGRKAWAHDKALPRPRSDIRSYHRPNSTHTYLTKTVTLDGTHDGFDPKHGTPTRAQLLRNRVKFSSAPDLTYSYLAQRRDDGKLEAFHQKTKIQEASHALKVSKIEMDRMANKYRQFLIGSKYNTYKWIDSHTNMVQGLVKLNERPASSFTTRPHQPLTSVIEDNSRAQSASGNNSFMRGHNSQTPTIQVTAEARPSSPVGLDTKVGETRTFPIPAYSKTQANKSKDARGSMRTSSRSPNLVPYTTPINSPGARAHLNSSIIIRPIKENHESLEEKKLQKAAELQERIAKSRLNVVAPPENSHLETESATQADVDNKQTTKLQSTNEFQASVDRNQEQHNNTQNTFFVTESKQSSAAVDEDHDPAEEATVSATIENGITQQLEQSETIENNKQQDQQSLQTAPAAQELPVYIPDVPHEPDLETVSQADGNESRAS